MTGGGFLRAGDDEEAARERFLDLIEERARLGDSLTAAWAFADDEAADPGCWVPCWAATLHAEAERRWLAGAAALDKPAECHHCGGRGSYDEMRGWHHDFSGQQLCRDGSPERFLPVPE